METENKTYLSDKFKGFSEAAKKTIYLEISQLQSEAAKHGHNASSSRLQIQCYEKTKELLKAFAENLALFTINHKWHKDNDSFLILRNSVELTLNEIIKTRGNVFFGNSAFEKNVEEKSKKGIAKLNYWLVEMLDIIEQDLPRGVVNATVIKNEAEQIIYELKEAFKELDLHEDILKSCTKEMMANDYFHAVEEAMKGLSNKIKALSGLENTDKDGGELAQEVFGGQEPIIKINNLSNKSDKSEQKGFCNFVIGFFGMYRNPLAHELRILKSFGKEEAVLPFRILSYLHKRLDLCIK